MTTQKILCEKFGIVRDKLEQATNIFVSVMMGAMLTMIYGAAPLILVSNYISFSGILNFLVPLVLVALGASGYMIKKNKDYMIAFNHLNSTLVENSLPAKITNSFKEQKDIDFKIKQKIREISILKMQLQVQKRVMESFKEDSKENAQIMEQVLSKSHNNEPALAGKKVTILEPVQDDLVGFSETDISLEPEEREAILVLKKTKK